MSIGLRRVRRTLVRVLIIEFSTHSVQAQTNNALKISTPLAIHFQPSNCPSSEIKCSEESTLNIQYSLTTALDSELVSCRKLQPPSRGDKRFGRSIAEAHFHASCTIATMYRGHNTPLTTMFGNTRNPLQPPTPTIPGSDW